jgi:hypothetical protein
MPQQAQSGAVIIRSFAKQGAQKFPSAATSARQAGQRGG